MASVDTDGAQRPSAGARSQDLEELERRIGRVRDVKWFANVMALTFGAIFTGVAGLGVYLMSSNLNTERTRIDDRFKEQRESFNFERTRLDDLLKEQRAASQKLQTDTTASFEKLRAELTTTLATTRAELTAGAAADSDRLRGEREKFEQNVRDLINQTGDAKLELLTANQDPLSNQEVPVKVVRRPPEPEDWYKENVDPYKPWTIKLTYALKNSSEIPSGPVAAKIYTKNPLLLSEHKSVDEPKFDHEDFVGPDNFANNIPGKITMAETISMHVSKFPNSRTYPIMMKLFYGRGKMVSANFFIIIDQQEPPPQSPSPKLPSPRR